MNEKVITMNEKAINEIRERIAGVERHVGLMPKPWLKPIEKPEAKKATKKLIM